MTIEEQKKLLTKRLEIEDLRSCEDNKNIINSFKPTTYGKKIVDYLQNEAWDTDKKRNVKAFLVRDTDTNEIVYFFAISCGILYEEVGSSLTKEDMELLEPYIKAMQVIGENNSSQEYLEKANELLNQFLNDLSNKVKDPVRCSRLVDEASSIMLDKGEKRILFSGTEEEEHVKHVHETFPAIDINFCVKIVNMTLGFHLILE